MPSPRCSPASPATRLPSRRALLPACLALALLAVPPSFSQTGGTMLVEPPAPLLPATLAGFTKSSPTPVGDGLEAVDPAKATVMKEDGLRRYERSDYSAGPAHGTITAYRFIDASGAYAAFCSQLPAGSPAPSSRVGDLSVVSPEGTMFRSGVNLVIAHFDASPQRTAAVLTALLPRLPKVAGPAGQPPLLPTYLPLKDLNPASVRYALGPVAYSGMGGILPASILAFDKSAETITAEYRRHNGEPGLLTLLLYPTPTIAGDQGRAIEQQFRTHPAPGTAALRREGPLLLLATGAFTPGEAQALIDGIHLRNEVTWNKAVPLEFHSEIKKTASLLTSIGVFCGVGVLAALLLGLFLGGARAGIRVLMGKPAASEPEFLRIDLSGKPAHPLGHNPVDTSGS